MANLKEAKWVQPVVDYIGLISFAATYAITRDLMKASWGLGIGSAVGLAVGLIIQRKIALLPLFTGGSAILFASLALIFHDTVFIKIKLTIIDGILAALLLGGLAMGKAPLKSVLGSAVTLTEPTWKTLTLRYGLLFLAIAVANEIIWRNTLPGGRFPESWWVLFRFPGIPIVTVIFSIAQTPLMMKDLKAQEDALPPPPAS